MISLISVAHAAADNKAQIAAKEFVVKINDAILFPLIALMMALAFLFFLWGAFEYVKNAENQTARETGKRHLIYGVLGMFIMLSAYAILNIAAGTFGLEKELKNANDPITTLAPSVSRLPTSRPDFDSGGYVPSDSTYWEEGIVDDGSKGVSDDITNQCDTVIINGTCVDNGAVINNPDPSDEVSGISLIVAELIASGWDPETAFIIGKSYLYYTDRDKAYDDLTVHVNAGTITARSRDQYIFEQFDSN
jgi:hypothetical protein